MRNGRVSARVSFAALAAAAFSIAAPLAAHAADTLLWGTIVSASGEKLGGVTPGTG